MPHFLPRLVPALLSDQLVKLPGADPKESSAHHSELKMLPKTLAKNGLCQFSNWRRMQLKANDCLPLEQNLNQELILEIFSLKSASEEASMAPRTNSSKAPGA